MIAAPDDVTGDWIVVMTCHGASDVMRMTLQMHGDRATACLGGCAFEGRASGSRLELRTPDGATPAARISGTFERHALSGEYVVGTTRWTWSATRPAGRAAGASRTHVFAPTTFHRMFSGSIPPALHIRCGDRVKTWTLDSSGIDADGARRSRPGNPQTGPFYVEGAVPGDTLAVTFTRMRLNRDTATSRRRIWKDAVTAAYIESRRPLADPDSAWLLDRAKGVARPAQPTPALAGYAVPLQPMLGCVAVAPPFDMALTSQHPGTFGGNIDYAGIREGVTVYLPVFQIGALLFIGDGHAAQGDGEVTVSALETSMDVEFVVDVLPGRTLATPCAEDAECLMAIGIERSLTRALQSATTEMARWLERDYGLDREEAATVLGTALRYDIAQVVNPHPSVVAKLPKAVMARVRKPPVNGERR